MDGWTKIESLPHGIHDGLKPNRGIAAPNVLFGISADQETLYCTVTAGGCSEFWQRPADEGDRAELGLMRYIGGRYVDPESFAMQPRKKQVNRSLLLGGMHDEAIWLANPESLESIKEAIAKDFASVLEVLMVDGRWSYSIEAVGYGNL